MGKDKKKSKGKKAAAAKLPKVKCCVKKSRCGRCPIRMLKDGTLPDGMTVKRRVLVCAEKGKPITKKRLQKAA